MYTFSYNMITRTISSPRDDDDEDESWLLSRDSRNVLRNYGVRRHSR